MKFLFKMVAATDITTFENLVNDYLDQGYRFMGTPVTVTEHESINGMGYQYTVPMLKEEQENANQ